VDVCCEKKLAGRRERRTEETREKIYRAALHLFIERGFGSTTIEAITNLADVGKGTFFNYFENKERVILMFGEKQLGRIQTFVDESFGSDSSLNVLIYRLAVSLTEEFGMNSAALFQSFITAAFTNDTVKERMSSGLAKGREVLAELVVERQQRGEIRGELAPAEVAQAFQRMLFGTMVVWSLNPEVPLEESLKKMTDLFLNGVQSSLQE
jgi:AcrR family transcriptional regulator